MMDKQIKKLAWRNFWKQKWEEAGWYFIIFGLVVVMSIIFNLIMPVLVDIGLLTCNPEPEIKGAQYVCTNLDYFLLSILFGICSGIIVSAIVFEIYKLIEWLKKNWKLAVAKAKKEVRENEKNIKEN